MLCTAFDFYEALASYVAAVDLEYTNKVGLPELTSLAYFSDILSNMKILLNFLFHINTPDGLNLVHLGLFY